MRRGRDRGRDRDRDNDKRLFLKKRKVCRFCNDSALQIDYKENQALKTFVTETGKIIPRRISGNCALHQRKVKAAIKRARNLALLPYTTAANF